MFPKNSLCTIGAGPKITLGATLDAVIARVLCRSNLKRRPEMASHTSLAITGSYQSGLLLNDGDDVCVCHRIAIDLLLPFDDLRLLGL